ncbi:hypothetical protein [Bartonella sp. DGB2]|uniref:hypothetical protein n=1 Tax=Bartonella sp. DGB2 TaxID=3388426 RepID=UPI00398F9C59
MRRASFVRINDDEKDGKVVNFGAEGKASVTLEPIRAGNDAKSAGHNSLAILLIGAVIE